MSGRRRFFALHAVCLLLLLAVTQVGVIAYAVALPLTRHAGRAGVPRWPRIGIGLAVFLLAYGLLTHLVIPSLAPLAGRVRVGCDGGPVVSVPVAWWLNRAYATPEMATLLADLANATEAQFPGSRITALDGSLPFFDGFPLLPHLSHHDGRKIDLGFFYRDAATGAPIPGGSPSPLGYFHYQQPRPGDPQPCRDRLTPLRWDFAALQPDQPAWILDENRTRWLIGWLNNESRILRVLLEPHLVARLGAAGAKIRFQGCHAARHDDHLHLEIGAPEG